MQYLVRFAQTHQTFRVPELEALARLANVRLKILHYRDDTPFCIVELEDEIAARALVPRAILIQSIYELWGGAEDYAALHENLQCLDAIDTHRCSRASFRFYVDCYQGKHGAAGQVKLIESFGYLPFHGPIKMHEPDFSMCIFEEYETNRAPAPRKVYLGRYIAGGGRHAVDVYNLKKRRYISRTSMDAELSLVTANLTLAAPGKIVYDPFVGTGSFTVACAHFGALALGSDIDPRSMRGTGKECNLFSNFEQYGLAGSFFDSFVADLTHTPLRVGQIFDAIVCDPPYGIREGPKVLGNRNKVITEPILVEGVPAHLPGYIPPRKPYGFDDMMSDVLDFSFAMLVDNGRLAIWMPTANDEDIELAIPVHSGLQLISVCVQQFNKWARRLLTYRRRPKSEISVEVAPRVRENITRATADQLNRFRKKYFEGFKEQDASRMDGTR